MAVTIHFGEINELVKTIEEYKRRRAPASEHFFRVLREPLRRLIPDDGDYDEVFDYWELLLALEFAHRNHESVNGNMDFWVPTGRYAYKGDRRSTDWIVNRLKSEFEESREEWPPLRAGMIGGSVKRAQEVMEAVETFVRRAPMH